MSSEFEQQQGGNAIEVATMLGDSVVDVKHCIDPHSGKITPKTWALFATGAVSMLVSGIAFAVSVSTAAYNKGAFDYWTQVAHKPAHSFRAQILSSGYDWLTFGGFVVGLVAIAAALLRMRDERKSPYYRIGTAPGVEQPIEGAPSEDFPLVAPAGDEFVFNFARNMTGEVIIDNRATPFAELVASGHARPSTSLPGAYELPLTLHPRIRAKVGQTSFMVTAVPKPRRHATPLFTVQSRTMAYFAGSLGVHLGIVLLLAQIPVEAGGATFDIAQHEMAMLKVTGETKEEALLEEPDEVADGTGGETAAGRQMELEAGAAGDPNKPRVATSKIRIKDNDLPPQLARLRAIEEARTAGILGSVALQSGDAFSSPTAYGNISSGFDSVNAYGAIYGADGEGYGNFGYARSGFGAGGGCDGTHGPCGGIIGSSYGEIGLGKFGNSGWNTRDGGIPGGRKHAGLIPNPVIGRPEAIGGGLDKEIIRRHIKRNLEKIKYCYEKQLLAHPGLTGTVSVAFFITPNGNVSSSVGSGMNTEAANCMAAVVSNIQFPKPTDGGGVQVNYPFSFKPVGQ